MDCPGKVKHFCWRLAHNNLANRTNLSRRGLDIGTRCVVCYFQAEDGGRLFLTCKVVKELWMAVRLSREWEKLSKAQSAAEMMSAILKFEKQSSLLACPLEIGGMKEIGEEREKSTEEWES